MNKIARELLKLSRELVAYDVDDAYDAHMVCHDVFAKLQKKWTDFDEYIEWSKISTSKLSSNEERGDWSVSLRIDVTDEARAVGASSYTIEARFFDKHGEVDISFSYGAGRKKSMSSPTNSNALASDLRKISLNVLNGYFSKVRKRFN